MAPKAKGVVGKKDADWKEVVAPEPRIMDWGKVAGVTLRGILTADTHDYAGDQKNQPARVYVVDTDDGPVAVFARGELARLMAVVERHPGPGAEIRIVFTEWADTSRGNRARRFKVGWRVPNETEGDV